MKASVIDPLVRGETTRDGSLTTITMTTDTGREVVLRLNPFTLKRLAQTAVMLLGEVERRQGRKIVAGTPVGIDKDVKPS